MLEHLHYSPQSQLDLDEIYDFVAYEREDIYIDRILNKSRDYAALLGEK